MKQILKKLVVLFCALSMIIGFQSQVFAQEVNEAKVIELMPEGLLFNVTNYYKNGK